MDTGGCSNKVQEVVVRGTGGCSHTGSGKVKSERAVLKFKVRRFCELFTTKAIPPYALRNHTLTSGSFPARARPIRDQIPFDSEIWRIVPLHASTPMCFSAVKHGRVEEIWYFIRGQGQVWRKLGDHEEVVDVSPGVTLTIPVETHFQFRNTGWEPLCFIIATVPPWRGNEDAVRVEDHRPTK